MTQEPGQGVTTRSLMIGALLAFAIGVAALLAFVRGRSWTALALAAAAGFFHPTIALWFVVWIASGIFVSDARARRPLVPEPQTIPEIARPLCPFWFRPGHLNLAAVCRDARS